jgi:hypothetical protein
MNEKQEPQTNKALVLLHPSSLSSSSWTFAPGECYIIFEPGHQKLFTDSTIKRSQPLCLPRNQPQQIPRVNINFS